MPNNIDFLIVDDDPVFLNLLERSLIRRNFSVKALENIIDATASLTSYQYSYAIIDLNIGNENGLKLIDELAHQDAKCRILMLTGYASIATAVDAIKRGAFQYLSKPASIDDIMNALNINQDTSEKTEPTINIISSVEKLEWEHIQRVLQQEGGNISATARVLGMHRRTLQRKLLKRPVKS